MLLGQHVLQHNQHKMQGTKPSVCHMEDRGCALYCCDLDVAQLQDSIGLQLYLL
jgi:hypothetical protein